MATENTDKQVDTPDSERIAKELDDPKYDNGSEIAKLVREGKLTGDALKDVREMITDPGYRGDSYKHLITAISNGHIVDRRVPREDGTRVSVISLIKEDLERGSSAAEDLVKKYQDGAAGVMTREAEKRYLKKRGKEIKEKEEQEKKIIGKEAKKMGEQLKSAVKISDKNWSPKRLDRPEIKKFNDILRKRAGLMDEGRKLLKELDSLGAKDTKKRERIERELREVDREIKELEKEEKKFEEYLERELGRKRALEDMELITGIDVYKATTLINSKGDKIKIIEIYFEEPETKGGIGDIMIRYINEDGDTLSKSGTEFKKLIIDGMETFEPIDTVEKLNEELVYPLRARELKEGDSFGREEEEFKIESIDEEKEGGEIVLDRKIQVGRKKKEKLKFGEFAKYVKKNELKKRGVGEVTQDELDKYNDIHNKRTQELMDGQTPEERERFEAIGGNRRVKTTIPAVGEEQESYYKGEPVPVKVKREKNDKGEDEFILEYFDNTTEKLTTEEYVKAVQKNKLEDTDELITPPAKTVAATATPIMVSTTPVPPGTTPPGGAPPVPPGGAPPVPPGGAPPVPPGGAPPVPPGGAPPVTPGGAPPVPPGGAPPVPPGGAPPVPPGGAPPVPPGGAPPAPPAGAPPVGPPTGSTTTHPQQHPTNPPHTRRDGGGGGGAGGSTPEGGESQEDSEKKDDDKKDKDKPKKDKGWGEALPYDVINKVGADTTQSRSYLKDLWADTYILSGADIYELGKIWYEYYQRRFERKQKERISTVSEDVPYFSPEMKRIKQQAEAEEVNQFKERFDQEGVAAIWDAMRNVNHQDELKACLIVLSEKGQLWWDDIDLWKSLNKFYRGSTPIPIPRSGDPRAKIDEDDDRTGMDFIQGVVDSIWGEGTYNGWYSKNKSAFESNAKGFYEKGNELEGSPGGHAKHLELLLEKHKNGEYVDAQEYEGIIRHAIDAGKSSMQAKLYYMIEGVAAENQYGRTIMSFDRIAHINSVLLGKFPILEYLTARPDRGGGKDDTRFTQEDYKDWIRRWDGNDYMNCKPNKAVDDFLWKYVLPSGPTSRRINKALRNAEQMDHDDMFAYVPPAAENLVENVCRTSAGTRQFLTAEGYANIYPGFSQYMKSLAKNNNAPKLREAVKSYVKFEAIMDNRWKKGKEGYQRMKPANMTNGTVVTPSYTPQMYKNELEPVLKKIIEVYGADNPKLVECGQYMFETREGDTVRDEDKAFQEQVQKALEDFPKAFDIAVKKDKGQKLVAIIEKANLIGMPEQPSEAEKAALKAKREALGEEE